MDTETNYKNRFKINQILKEKNQEKNSIKSNVEG
jgi:hypothetical protein